MIDCSSNDLLKIAESIDGEMTVDDLGFLLGFAKAVQQMNVRSEELGAAKMLQILFDKDLIKYKD